MLNLKKLLFFFFLIANKYMITVEHLEDIDKAKEEKKISYPTLSLAH